LEVRFRERNVADVLAMSIAEATTFFENVPKLHRRLTTFVDVGLGYLGLGQSALTLSGGEAQRVKLASELSPTSQGEATLFVLDEPTTGLHPADVEQLLSVLQRLVEAGQTVVVVEHDVDVIWGADWVIDLGPDGGDQGGAIVATGPPEAIREHLASHTGAALRAAAGSAWHHRVDA
jgi:excinuclease ABC subunit A